MRTPSSTTGPITFHIGYHDLHPDPTVNFQMNRWITYLGPSEVPRMRAIASRLTDVESYREQFLAAAQQALVEDRTVAAAYYFRSAEFFMWHDDPRKAPTRNQFLQLIRQGYGIGEEHRHLIGYDDGRQAGMLPAYRLTPDRPVAQVLVHGGYDSYIEEFLPVLLWLRDAGYDVIAFEGPGQGSALEEHGLTMTAEWHRPVAAVLDHFGLTGVTLVGVSLGGCLALRAAAFEPRIGRVVADEVCYDMFGVITRQLPRSRRALLTAALGVRAKGAVDFAVRQLMTTSPRVEWLVRQGLHITGATSPYDFLQAVQRWTTRDISSRITQDVLILAGSEDHFIPLEQFHLQMRALTHARSLTGRVFTRAEQAHNHCAVGNVELSLRVFTAWMHTLDQRRTRSDVPIQDWAGT